MSTDVTRDWHEMADELRNFQEIARLVKPSAGEIPTLDGVDIHGTLMPLRHVIGGDHLLYVDFKKRYDLPHRIQEAERRGRADVADRLREQHRRAGILLADVSGHRMTDALIAAMLHQAFLLGVYYELEAHGEITTTIFEHINARFYQTSSVAKYLTMIYGEIWHDGRFRFISAGHRPPAVFSREYGRFVSISADRLVSFPPIGMLPRGAEGEADDTSFLPIQRRPYEINEIHLLSPGDILLLHTDGLSEHADGAFFPARVERLLADCGDASAREICDRLREEILRAAPPDDDISFVVAKKTQAS
jgi:serine phosphatase RsbU (regulator of sigma subunit)